MIAYIESPGYEYERQRTSLPAVNRTEGPTEEAIVEAGRQANIVLVEYPVTPITARVAATSTVLGDREVWRGSG
jgi:hypothetical protein